MSVTYEKRFKLLSVFIIITGLCIQLYANEQDFKWMFYEQEHTTCSSVQTDKINISELKNKLHIFFKPQKRVFLYLLLSGPESSFTLLFPDAFSAFTGKSYIENEYILPADGDWKKFAGEPGEYLLYFIVSKSRLKNLEKTIMQYQQNRDKDSESDLPQLHMKIQAEINRVLRDWFFSDNKLSPDSSMGTYRNDDFFSKSGTGSNWVTIFDSSEVSGSAYEVFMEKEGFVVIFTCAYE